MWDKGSVLQTALCYLEAIRANVPELVEREKIGDGVQGEPDLSGKIAQGDLEADIPSVEDLIHEIYTAGPNFMQVCASIDLILFCVF
jgi:hypothetical protein